MLANCDRPSSSHYTQSKAEEITGMTRKQRGQAEITCGPSLSFNFIRIGKEVYSELIGRKE